MVKHTHAHTLTHTYTDAYTHILMHTKHTLTPINTHACTFNKRMHIIKTHSKLIITHTFIYIKRRKIERDRKL